MNYELDLQHLIGDGCKMPDHSMITLHMNLYCDIGMNNTQSQGDSYDVLQRKKY